MSDLIVGGVVAIRDYQPYIQLLNENGLIAQLTMSEARKIAMDILVMASRTEMDAMVHKFFADIGGPEEAGTHAMALFRDFRAKLDQELVEGSSSAPEEGG